HQVGLLRNERLGLETRIVPDRDLPAVGGREDGLGLVTCAEGHLQTVLPDTKQILNPDGLSAFFGHNLQQRQVAPVLVEAVKVFHRKAQGVPLEPQTEGESEACPIRFLVAGSSQKLQRRETCRWRT